MTANQFEMAINQIGKRVFISYRSKDIKKAQKVKDYIISTEREVILFPPEILSAVGEILKPFEFLELMEFILDEMHKCNTLIAVDQGDFLDSYWTQIELTQWRRFNDHPQAFSVRVNEESGSIQYLGELNLTTLSNDEKRLWIRISNGTNRKLRESNPHTMSIWGRYARSCFLVPCGACGEHFLVSKEALYASVNNEFKTYCPHCSRGPFQFSEGEKNSTFYRKPIFIKRIGQKKPRLLDVSEILTLLVNDKELPSTIKLVSLPDQEIYTEGTKNLIGVATSILGLTALAGIIYFFSSNKDDTN